MASTQIKTQDIAALAVTAAKLALPTTKGDLLGYDTAPNRIPVGTDGQVLVADSTQVLGIKWAASPSAPVFVDSEVPAGSVNGTNTVFTLAGTPLTGSEHLYKNGMRQKRGATDDYTIVNATITFLAGNVPQTGDVLLADYRQ